MCVTVCDGRTSFFSTAVTWSVRADVECIVCSQFSPHVAAFVRKNGSLNG